MFISHLTEAVAQLNRAADAAADATGKAAVSAILSQMEHGYDSPIRRTGALMRNVSFTREGHTVRIGNTLPYARLIHDGTSRHSGRPYLTDGLMNHADALEEAAAQALKDNM